MTIRKAILATATLAVLATSAAAPALASMCPRDGYRPVNCEWVLKYNKWGEVIGKKRVCY